MPYDGEIKADHFWYLQAYCVALWWMNNYFLINFIPSVAILWSADWSFTDLYNGVDMRAKEKKIKALEEAHLH